MYEDLAASIKRLAGGETAALDRVVQLLYDELRGLARQRLRSERGEHTLGATALVNEAYLRLARQHKLDVESRTQFFAVASTTMRRILVDYARTRTRVKRGGVQERVPLEDDLPFLSDRETDELLALEDALVRLAEANPEAASLVEHRFFSGLTVEEIAEMRGVSSRTLQREWVAARAWLRKEVARDLGLPD
ncbi:MAG: sigma-70 family RNA polymerase sigma factor [Candidatus Eisenbacteria bacterium]|nr:sigma-70 family RNA polymerase sigma factor [Candidatus Eisenbacteria bacterium]MCC7144752.1 sigma-70 family RNA polymerase sigma factor [Candidatus Eisenbacteria bacterium]